MADDIFQSIYEELKKINEKLTNLDVDIVSALQDGQTASEPQTESTKEDKGPAKLLDKVFGFAKKFGKVNPVTSFAETLAKQAQELSDKLGKKVGSDGAAATDGGKRKPGFVPMAPPIQPDALPLSQRIAASLRNGQSMPLNTRLKGSRSPDNASGPVNRLKSPATKSVAQTATKTAAGATTGNVAKAGATVVSGASALVGPLLQAGAAVASFAAGILLAVPGLGEVVGVALLVVGVFAALAAGAVALTAKFLESQKELAKYNAKLAVSFAQSKFRDIQRDIRKGAATATGTSNLNEAFSDFKDAFAPVTIAITNLTTAVLTPIIRVLTKILEFMAPLFNAISFLAEKINAWLGGAPKAAQLTPAEQFFKDIGQGRPIPRQVLPIK